ncbi:MAG: hypothetical protein ABI742_13455 [Gemmatimonadota bacterium]
MPASTFLPKLCFGLAAAFGLILGLTTYTFPIFGRLQDHDVQALIHQALHDSIPPLPGPPAQLGIQTGVGTPPADAKAPVLPAQPAAWAAAAASADSSALRDWLTQPGVFTGTTVGNRVHTTLWRLNLHQRCPWLSHLRTVSIRTTGQLLEVSSDCPRTDAIAAAVEH